MVKNDCLCFLDFLLQQNISMPKLIEITEFYLRKINISMESNLQLLASNITLQKDVVVLTV